MKNNFNNKKTKGLRALSFGMRKFLQKFKVVKQEQEILGRKMTEISEDVEEKKLIKDIKNL